MQADLKTSALTGINIACIFTDLQWTLVYEFHKYEMNGKPWQQLIQTYLFFQKYSRRISYLAGWEFLLLNEKSNYLIEFGGDPLQSFNNW